MSRGRWVVALLPLGVCAMLVGMPAGVGGGAVAAQAQAQADSLWALALTTGPAWQAGLPAGTQAGFGSHSRNLARLRREGRILFGGRYGGVGLLVFRAASEAEVRAMLAPDSTIASGVFAAEIHAWRTIYDGVVPRR